MTLCVDPPGARACRDGGTWEFYRANPISAGANSVNEYQTCIATDPLANLDIQARIADRMDLAENGKCTFGSAPNDVGEVNLSRSELLEMRWDYNPGFGNGSKMVLRMYFAEPIKWVNVLLSLHWHFKAGSGPYATSQNAAMLEADRRLNMGERCWWGH